VSSTIPNPVLIEESIQSRIVASMAHTDILVNVQGVAFHMASSSFEAKVGADPYIVADLISGDFLGTFGADGIRAMYRVTIHDHPENGGVNAAMAFRGLWGDWHPITNTTPNYGLHMWTPAGSGMVPSRMVAKRWSTPHTPDALSYSIMFQMLSYNQE